jgi:hypothetical protein
MALIIDHSEDQNKIKEDRKYIFIKDYPYGNNGEKIKKGSDLRFVREVAFVDGFMMLPGYRAMLAEVILNKDLKKEYIREEQIIQNKV